MYVTVLVLSVALFCAAAPLIGRSTNLPPLVVALMVSIGSVLFFLPTAARTSWSSYDLRSIAIAGVAGLANGAGLYSIYALVGGATEGKWSFALVPIGLIGMIAALTLGGSIFYHDPLTAKKVAGLALALVAIWLLH